MTALEARDADITKVEVDAIAQAALIEVEEVRRHLAAGSALESVVFCVHGAQALRAFEHALAQPGN